MGVDVGVDGAEEGDEYDHNVGVEGAEEDDDPGVAIGVVAFDVLEFSLS